MRRSCHRREWQCTCRELPDPGCGERRLLGHPARMRWPEAMFEFVVLDARANVPARVIADGLGPVLGVADPSFSFLPACSCVQHASLEVVHVGSAYTWQVPMVPSAVGFECYTQGVQVEVPGSTLPCDVGAGFRFGLTDGYKIRFW